MTGRETIAAIRGRAVGGVPANRKAVNLAEATSRVVRAKLRGQSVWLPKEERERRLAICRDCEFWAEKGNLGFGECRHPQCGCTRLKQGLSTEHCPLNKWGTTVVPGTTETTNKQEMP